jgi:hypothetical protein
VAAVAAVAIAFLWIDSPLWLQALSAFALAIWLPGLLVTQLLLGEGDAPVSPIEWVVYPVAFGFMAMTLLLLVASYLPGGLVPWQARLILGGATLVLALLVLWRGRRPHSLPQPTTLPDLLLERRQWLPLVVGLLLIVGVAAFFRFANIGYAEFHGDEGRAVLRSAAVMQGYENVLFIHRKPPGEILAVTTVFSYAGRIDEAAARIPFALASMAALLGVFLLGWRLRSLVVGSAAMLLLTLDGYLVAFSRFVQYQSVVLLASVAAVLVMHRLYREPRSPTRLVLASALFLATALLYHWDGALAFLPVGVLFLSIGLEKRIPWRLLVRAAIPGLVVGVAALALFFVPYLLQPNAEAAASYLINARLVGESAGLPNNTADIVARTLVYSSVYHLGVLIALAGVALIAAWRQGWFRAAAIGAAIALVVALVATLWRPGGDSGLALTFTALCWLVLFGGVWVAPGLKNDERAIWLWFGVPLLASLYLIATPRTHVHIFFVPWAIAAGLGADLLWRALAVRAGPRRATWATVAAGCAVALVGGGWLYLAFVDAPAEMVRNRAETRPLVYWAPEKSNTIDALYGFPLRNGWKAAGTLYADGTLAGDYDVLLWADYISWWYLRDQWRCYGSAEWYFTVRGLEPWAEPPEAAFDRLRAEGFVDRAVVHVNGQPAMRIFGRSEAQGVLPAEIDVESAMRSFDATADPWLTLAYPAIEPPAPIQLNANFGNQLVLEGYDFRTTTPLRPGEPISVTLYWRGQVQMEHSYKVTIQAYDDQGNFAAQADSAPVCDRRLTNHWRPGEAVVDRHALSVNESASPGRYALYAAIYREETGERIPVLSDDGLPVDDKLKIADIEVVAP